MVLINVGHPRGSDRLEKVLSATMGPVFSTSRATPSRTPTAAPGHRPPAVARRGSTPPRTLPPDLRAVAARGRARGWRPRCRGGAVYTDDRAPVEWLIDASIVDYAEGE